MKYLVATFTLKCESDMLQIARDLMADAAAEAGFESFEDTDQGFKGYVQKELFDRDELDASIQEFPLPGVEVSYDIEDAEDKDWNAEWEEQGFEPINVDDRIIIYDAKHTTLDELASYTHHQTMTTIAIDAKLAFGTGTHQTTQMIVSNLEKLHVEDKRILDCGCGTGILGIAAAKMGANDVVGYDIDEWSVDNAKHNAEINGVTNMQIYHGDATVLNHISGIFDIVMANINRNILLADMHAFKDVMAQGATLILSGFYEDDVPTLLDKAAEFNLHEVSRSVNENWTCLVLK